MPYPPEVLDHFEHPRRVGSLPASDPAVGTGFVQAPQHGDVIRLQLQVAPEGERVTDARFKAYGCGWAIACASLAADRMPGRSLDEVLAIGRDELARALSLPADKMHCARLAEAAVAAAVADIRRKRAGAAALDGAGGREREIR